MKWIRCRHKSQQNAEKSSKPDKQCFEESLCINMEKLVYGVKYVVYGKVNRGWIWCAYSLSLLMTNHVYIYTVCHDSQIYKTRFL